MRDRAADSPRPWQRFATDVVWNVTGAVFNQGSTLALGLVVANVLGREQYGIYGFLLSTMLLFMNVGQMAMGVVTTKFVGEYHIREKARAGGIIALCLGFSIATGAIAAATAFLLAPAIAANVLHSERAATLIRLSAPAVFFTILNIPCTGILAGFGNFRKNAVAGIAGGIVYIAVGTLMAIRFGLAAVIAGIGASACFQCALLLVLVFSEAKRQGVPIAWPSRASIAAERANLVHVALPFALTGFSSLPAIWLANAILVRQPGGIAALALFNAANSLRQVVLFAPYLMSNVGFSMLSRYRGTADHEGFRHAFWMNVLAVGAVALLLAGIIIGGGHQILRLFGPAFAAGYPVLALLVASTIPEALSVAVYQLIQSRGLIWISFFFVALPRDTSLVGVAYFLAPRGGAFGLAEAFMISILIMLAWSLGLARKLGIRPVAEPAAVPA